MATASLDEAKAKKVLRQVEFYFSDSNLPRDNFLKKSIEEAEDGLVTLALICSFARMRNHLGLGEVKPDEVPEDMVLSVAETLRRSSFLKISDDGKRVGRNSEMLKPEEVIEQVDSRTIAASPLEYNIKLEDVESFFSQYGKVNSVRLPRHISDKRLFCGSALIEFSTEDEARSLLNHSVIYAGVELKLKPKKDYDSERENKMAEYEKSHPSLSGNSETGSKVNDRYQKGLIISFKLKPKPKDGSTVMEQHGTHLEEESKDVNAIEDSERSEKVYLKNCQNALESGNGIKEKRMDVNMEDGESTALDYSNRIVKKDVGDDVQRNGEVALNGSSDEKIAGDDAQKNIGATKDSSKENEENAMEPKEIVTREDLKQVFQRFGTVKYVDFSMGDESGYIRFEQPEAAQKSRAAAVLCDEGGIIVKSCIAFLEAVTGDAEKEYWSRLRQFQDNRGYRGRGRNNRGGRHFDGKRSYNRGRDSAQERPNKFQKVAASS